jgi:hypothetical protein
MGSQLASEKAAGQPPSAASAFGGTRGQADASSAAHGLSAKPRDAFPHTRRPLPWLAAGFAAILFFVPIASTELKVHLPVDSRIDRFVIIGLVLAWTWLGGDQRAFMRTRRSKLFVTAICVYLTIAMASVLVDPGRMVGLGETTLVLKRFALLGSFVVLSWFILTALRYEDVRGFATYLIGLASIMSIGVLVERRTGTNLFYEWSKSILGPIATVAPSPTDVHPLFGGEERLVVVGPTNHGLATTAMLVMVMPFALVRVLDAASRKSRWLNAGAFALIVAGALATDRKTAVLVPVALVLYIAWYRPRQMLRLAPIGLIALIAVVHFAAPKALGTVFNLNRDVNGRSTEHRANDIPDVKPDILAHPVLGRGFGTDNYNEPSVFRVNDNEYIDQIWEVGALGLLAFLWMILSPIVLARRAIRGREPPVASLALAGSAACAAFLVACVLFDALSFPQAPYMFFIVAALTTIAAGGPEGNVVRSRQLVPRPVASAKRMRSVPA